MPKSKTIRQVCLSIFTSTTAPNPIELLNERTQRHSGKHKKASRELKESKIAFANSAFKSAVENEALPSTTADRIHAFISYGNSLPYPTDVRKALDVVFSSCKRLYQTDVNGKNKDHKGLQRAFEEVVKSISQIKSFLDTIESFGIVLAAAQGKNKTTKRNAQLSHPSYIALDLGLNNGQLHYHGINYQAILVQDNFFEEDKSRSYRGFSTRGVRIAEGGR